MEFNATFIAVIISFIVFVFVMNKLLYIPVRNIVKEREDFVQKNYDTADENNNKADTLSTQFDEKIAEAEEDARIQYNEALSEYKDKRAQIIQDAQNDSRSKIENAGYEMENISNDAKNRIKGRLTDLANDIVEKLLGYRSEVQGFNNEEVDRILYSQER